MEKVLVTQVTACNCWFTIKFKHVHMLIVWSGSCIISMYVIIFYAPTHLFYVLIVNKVSVFTHKTK